MTTDPQNILIADDHALVRAGFSALLQSMEGIGEIREVSNGQEVIDLMPVFLPDIIFMDVSMPVLNGIATTAILRDKYPEVKIIALSMHADDEIVLQAVQAGINGYLLKDADLEELETAIQTVTEGGVYLSPSISRRLVKDIANLPVKTSPGTVKLSREILTYRQKQILSLIAQGKNSKEIAHILQISPKTVDAHRYNIMHKLNMTEVAQLVHYAIKTGLITLD